MSIKKRWNPFEFHRNLTNSISLNRDSDSAKMLTFSLIYNFALYITKIKALKQHLNAIRMQYKSVLFIHHYICVLRVII